MSRVRDLHDQGECGVWCPACAAEDEREANESEEAEE